MDLSGFMDSIISFAQNNTIIAIVLVLGLLYFLYRKPKLFFVLLFLGLFLYGLFYMITSMGGSGAAQKKKMIQQEEKQAD
jgi:multisubunit Na+/H+ antiporter MnhC subunit